MRKTSILATAAAAAMLMAAGQAMAQNNSTSVDASATIVTPLVLTVTNPLAFGSIIPSATAAGTVTFSASSDEPTYVVVTPTSNPGLVNRAELAVSGGLAAESTTLEISETSVDLIGANSSETMVVDTFLVSAPTVLNVDGEATFYVGARLNVGANQAADTYTGSFTATVNYN